MTLTPKECEQMAKFHATKIINCKGQKNDQFFKKLNKKNVNLRYKSAKSSARNTSRDERKPLQENKSF